MARQDYLCDETGDLLFENGDLVVGDSDEQHINDILRGGKGHFPEDILLGADLIRFVKAQSNRTAEGIRVIKTELKKDGYNRVKVTVGDKGLEDFTVSL